MHLNGPQSPKTSPKSAQQTPLLTQTGLWVVACSSSTVSTHGATAQHHAPPLPSSPTQPPRHPVPISLPLLTPPPPPPHTLVATDRRRHPSGDHTLPHDRYEPRVGDAPCCVPLPHAI
eukprot:1215736-Prymnesium_polylepis.1